jgi:integrase
MNFIDMSLLQWKNVSNDRISYTRQKTKELFNMQLLQPAIEILNSYRPITFSTPNSYIFPIFNENHNTPQSLHNRRVKMNREINSQLKDLAGKAKISSELTTYVARHTYATVMKRSGQSTALISEALGHDSEKTTQIYLDSFENSILDEASKSIL